MKKKKKLAFLFGFTPNLTFAAANAALGINRYISISDYDIIMLYTDLSDGDRAALEKIPHVKLVKFEFPDGFTAHMLANIPTESRFRTLNHLMCFAHFEVFKWLDEYENVVWNDVDIGVQGDLAGILNYAPFGLCKDTPWKVVNQFTGPIPGWEMDIDAYCSGVMIANDSLPYKQMYDFCYGRAIEYAKYLINPDQSIINLMLQQFNIVPRIVPLEEYNCISWRDDANVAKIVHFGTEQKVWNNTNICNAFPEWYRTHLQWLAMGGGDFDRSKITPRNCRGALDTFDKMSADKTRTYKLFGFLPILSIRRG